MADINSRREQVNEVLAGQVGQGMKQIFASTMLGLLATYVSPWLVLTGVPVLMGIDYFVRRSQDHAFYRNMRLEFGAEIAALAGVPVIELTTEKTRDILLAHHHDPKFKPFETKLDLQEMIHGKRTLNSFLQSAVSSLLVAVAAAFHMPVTAITVYTGGGTALLFGALNTLQKADIQAEADKDILGPVHDVVRQAMGQQVQLSTLLQVYLQAQPELQRQVAQQFGKTYNDMLPMERNQVVAWLDAPLHLRETAQKINEGAIRPTEVAWMAYGMHSSVPERQPIPHPPLSAPVPIPMRSNFVARLQEQEAAEKLSSLTIH